MRPFEAFRPVSIEPTYSCIVAAHGDVRPGTDSAELFAVLEDAAADGLFLDLGGSTISVGDLDEMSDVDHSPIIGKLTAHVNGFLTARTNLTASVN